MFNKNKYLTILIVVCFSLGINPSLVLAAPDHLVISQIQITGGSGHSTDDFIEIFNPTNQAFDLKGLRLVKRTASGTTDTTLKSWTESILVPAYGFYLWANSAYTNLSPTADVTTTGSIAENNSIALRQGPADTGTIIDAVAWGTVSNGLVETSAFAGTLTSGQAITRSTSALGSRTDTDNNSQDFTLQNSNPHNSQSAVETPASQDQNNNNSQNNNNTNLNTNSNNEPPIVIYVAPPSNIPKAGDVVINELVSDPVDGSEEWVEIYNRTSRVMELSDFVIKDGSGAVTKLSGSLGVDSSSRFMAILSPKGNLNNEGDQITLYYKETVIDQMSYGSWNDGNVSNNAIIGRDPRSVCRGQDGIDSDEDGSDFTICTPTLAQSNQIFTESAAIAKAGEAAQLVLSEVYPNPPLGDESEFIELQNIGTAAIDLNNWVLADEVSTYTLNSKDFTNLTLAPQAYFLLPRAKTHIALDNDGVERITLTSADGNIKLKINYSGPVKEGISYVRNTKGDWQWTTKPTPATVNELALVNQPPHVVITLPTQAETNQLIVFDASDTIDPDGDSLSYAWQFGDGTTSEIITPSHVYAKAGKFVVSLQVTDSSGQSASEKKTLTVGQARVAGTISGPLLLTEIMPNPAGSDSDEWLEVYNPGETSSSTSGWKIKINGSEKILPDVTVEPGEYVTLHKASTRLTLPNTSGVISLISPQGNAVSTVSYRSVSESSSLAVVDGAWQWTTSPTPGSENIIVAESNDSNFETVDLDALTNLENSSRVSVEGTVMLEPNILGKNLFFLEAGLPVVITSKRIAAPQAGDQVILQGTVSRASAYSKLVVGGQGSLRIIRSGASLPLATNLALADVTEDQQGKLVEVSGRVLSASARSFTIGDGGSSLLVKLRSTSDWPKFSPGNDVKVRGWAVLGSKGMELWPAQPSDLSLLSISPVEQTINLSSPTSKTENIGWNYILGAFIVLIGLTLLQAKTKYLSSILGKSVNLIRYLKNR